MHGLLGLHRWLTCAVLVVSLVYVSWPAPMQSLTCAGLVVYHCSAILPAGCWETEAERDGGCWETEAERDGDSSQSPTILYAVLRII